MGADPFLKLVAGDVLSRYGHELHELAAVFPGRRPRLYFSKYLGELSPRPVFVPRPYTITELMAELSGITIAEELVLVFRLMECYMKLTGKTESPNDIYSHCQTILADFDEVDKHLANARDLYSNLAALKDPGPFPDYLEPEQVAAIQRFWSGFNPPGFSPGQQEFLTLWELFGELYLQFRDSLKQEGIGYEGMASRTVAELIRSGNTPNFPYKKYLMVGFNALNPCEEVLFYWLKAQNKAEFYWDYDSLYTSDPMHEAGQSLRENLRRYPQALSPGLFNNLAQTKKNVTVVGVPSQTAACAVIPHFLSEITNRGEKASEETAIVLANESLLQDLLAQVPAEYQHINVSMGLPMISGNSYAFIRSVSDLCLSSRPGTDEMPLYFAHQELYRLLTNPVLRFICPLDAEKLIAEIVKKNKAWVGIHPGEIHPFLASILSPPEESGQLVKWLSGLINELLQLTNEGLFPPVEREFMLHALQKLNQINQALAEVSWPLHKPTIIRIVTDTLRSDKIPFSGEPLQGIQVLGMLETRLLDFSHVLLLLANEEFLPGDNTPASYIPASLRVGFGLSLRENRDAIVAYNFYRLLQRAELFTAVYCTRQGGISTGERSRYLLQLAYDKRFEVTAKNLSGHIAFHDINPVVVYKKERELHLLQEYLSEGQTKAFSPSALNTYLNCSLRFYFRYLVGLKEPEVFIKETNMPMFGSILHRVMELLYTPWLTKTLNGEDIDGMLSSSSLISKTVRQAFVEIMHGGDETVEPGGENLIAMEVIGAYAERVLQYDKILTPIRLVGLEMPFSHPVKVDTIGAVWVSGIIDRIDEVGGRLRVIDYKTGASKNSFNSIDGLFQLPPSKRNNAIFQTFFYALACSTQTARAGVMPGLYFVRDMFSEGFDYRIKMKPDRNTSVVVESADSYFPAFQNSLEEMFRSMFNPNIPFSQTDDIKYCENCPYKGICHR